MWLRYLLLLIAVFHCVWTTVVTTTTEKYDILTAEYPKENEDLVQPIPDNEIRNNQQSPASYKTITELVNKQTEAIKKIISEQQQPQTPHNEYPVAPKNDEIKEQLEKDSIEELKKKCQHLSGILNSEIPRPPVEPTTESHKVTASAFGPYVRPDFLKFKPKFPSAPVPLPISQSFQSKPPQMSGNYFIFTQNPEIYGKRTNKYTDRDQLESADSTIDEVFAPSEEEQEQELEETEEDGIELSSAIEEETPITTTTPVAVTTPKIIVTTTNHPSKPSASSGFKYVPLEPLILKQSLLPTGKAVFYWYRLLPITQSFVQIPDIPAYKDVTIVAQPQTYNQNVLLPEQYQYYMDPLSGQIKPNKPSVPSSTTTTTTTSTEKPQPQPLHTRPQFFINPQTGMIYQSALPHQFIYHTRVPPVPPTATTTTSTTTTTTEKIPVPEYTVEITQQLDEKPPSVKPLDNNYRHEFRFVIPMVVTGTQEETIADYPNKLDPYAYLPKGQRPEMMNIQVPYSPTYQMIRTLAVPNKLKRDVVPTTNDKNI